MRLQVGSSRFETLVDCSEMPGSQCASVVLTQTVLGTEPVLEAVLVGPYGIEVDSCANPMQGKSLEPPLELLLRTRREAFEVRSFHPHGTMLAPSLRPSTAASDVAQAGAAFWCHPLFDCFAV